MKSFRIILSIVFLIMTFSMSGCRGGNASKIFNVFKREAKQEVAEQVVNYAVREATGTSSPKSSTKSSTSNGYNSKPGGSTKANIAKAGVAAVAGTAVANEVSAYSQNVNQAKDVLVGYYTAIADKRMREAYNSLTWEMQNQLGTFENYSRGYDTTVSNNVSNVEVISENSNEIRLSYQLNSIDNINGKILKQTFLGKVTLTKMDGKWLISGFDVKVK